MALAGSQMPAYSEAKEYLTLNHPDVFTPNGVQTTFMAALAGSLAGNTLSLPMDVVKSRIQNMPTPKAEPPSSANAPVHGRSKLHH